MRKSLIMLAVAAAWLFLSEPPTAHAQNAIDLTNQAIGELTDPPANGGRISVDINKTWGSNVNNINNATKMLEDALSAARSGGASRGAVHQLEMAVGYGRAKLHKEARLSAQGALYHLCQGGGGGAGCDKAPKFGSYVAP
jgi:hypothetical protein